MSIGTIKWFNNAKGYGFILGEGANEEDLFVHYSSINMEGYKTLKAGQIVSYDTIQGPKGLHAVNIMFPNAQDTVDSDDLISNADRQVSSNVPITEP